MIFSEINQGQNDEDNEDCDDDTDDDNDEDAWFFLKINPWIFLKYKRVLLKDF